MDKNNLGVKIDDKAQKNMPGDCIPTPFVKTVVPFRISDFIDLGGPIIERREIYEKKREQKWSKN